MQIFQSSFSIVCAMASSSKRVRVEESDSEDWEKSVDLLEETTGGTDSGEESELDHLLADESAILR